MVREIELRPELTRLIGHRDARSPPVGGSRLQLEEGTRSRSGGGKGARREAPPGHPRLRFPPVLILLAATIPPGLRGP